jgi:hypothetical protein
VRDAKDVELERAAVTRWIAVVAVYASIASSLAIAQKTIAHATIDPSGEVRITYSDGRERIVPKLKEEAAFERPRIAQDRRTVGWLADYPNCCTSYPIPMVLVIYRDGGVLRSIFAGMPIWHWIFLAGGTRVAIYTDTVHSGLDPNYELRDVNSGRIVASWDPSSPRVQPEWVKLLESDTSKDP